LEGAPSSLVATTSMQNTRHLLLVRASIFTRPIRSILDHRTQGTRRVSCC
jgi:hypothetical protein